MADKFKKIDEQVIKQANDRIEDLNWMNNKIAELRELKDSDKFDELDTEDQCDIAIELHALISAHNALVSRLERNGIELVLTEEFEKQHCSQCPHHDNCDHQE